MRLGERRVLVSQFLAHSNCFILLACYGVIVADGVCDNRGQRIAHVSSISFDTGLFLSASKQANVLCVALMGGGILWVRSESLLALSLSPEKIPVIVHFDSRNEEQTATTRDQHTDSVC
jgi:hypothetical protein